jgi:PIN domain nuclease of toxin-antitoxin system
VVKRTCRTVNWSTFSSRSATPAGSAKGEDGTDVFSVLYEQAGKIENLEVHHRDPFDRIFIAQSLEEKLPLVTADPIFEGYPVGVIW